MPTAHEHHADSSPADVVGDQIDAALHQVQERTRATARDRRKLVNVVLILSAQSGLAAALAWVVAHELLGNPSPVFAPGAAVGTIAAALGQRAQRTIGLLIGIGLGIVVGDLLILLLGTGPWQIGAIVALAIASALVLSGGSGSLVAQAGGTAVLISAVSPAERDLEIPRIVDAAVGSGVGLIVVALLLPLNPLRLVEKAARPVFSVLTSQLRETAEALSERNPERAIRALNRVRGMGTDVSRLRDALSGAQEVVLISPARWHRRRPLARYAHAIGHMEHFVRDVRGLIRRAATTIEHGEPIPDQLPAAVNRLAEAVGLFRAEHHADRDPDLTRKTALRAVHEAAQAYAVDSGFSGNVVVAQIRTAASDLLRATGIDTADSNSLVRRTAKNAERDRNQARNTIERD